MRNLKYDKDVIEQMNLPDIPQMFSETVALHAIDRAIATEWKVEVAEEALEDIHNISKRFIFPAIEVISEQTLAKIKADKQASTKDKLIRAQVSHIDTVNAEMIRLQEHNKRLKNTIRVVAELLSTSQARNSCLEHEIKLLKGESV